ncbi:riboflavin biosynthesis protein RibF [bacterium]|nr:riboflavin biosynthesis protein RibF [bacterium]
MKTEYLLNPSFLLKETAVAVGSFDGLHLGHRDVISSLLGVSSKKGLKSVVLTFSRHPRAFLARNGFPVLTTESEKISLLSRLGVDSTVFVEFSESFASQSAEEFILNYLIDSLGMKALVLGKDHAFGRDRCGQEVLRSLGKEMGFEVIVVESVLWDNLAIKSTRIRDCLIAGEMSSVAQMLGRPYSISGVVSRGMGRGGKLGFPTVNIKHPEDKLLPPNGVYISTDGDGMPGLLYVGSAPTFGEREIVAEFHGVNSPRAEYGQEFAVSVIERLRGEKTFQSSEDLVRQMDEDKRVLVKWLKDEGIVLINNSKEA